MKKLIFIFGTLFSFSVFSQDVVLNENSLQLRSAPDKNHSLQWRGTLLGYPIDGPLLKGWSGGALGTSKDGDNSVLTWRHNGNVGIGVPIPEYTLDVNGSLRVGGTPWTNIQIVDRDFSGSHAILFNAKTSNNYVPGSLSTTGNTKFSNDAGLYQGGAGGVFFEGNHGVMTFHVSDLSTGQGTNINWGAPEISIIRNGHVGIGTISPTERLTVNGGILCEKVRVIVDVPASDYVFEEEYDLMTLEEVDLFIKENKHLPEVPSAKEFKENGYNIGEMDDLLLRKVEELTLYIIKLEKELNSLKN